MSLLRKTAIGVVWSFVERMARRGVTVAATVLLAAFLTPEDYGLVALTGVFLAVGSAFADSGMRESLIRKEEATEEDYSSAFAVNLVISMVVVGVIGVGAPWFAAFYGEPALVAILRVISLALVFRALEIVQVARLTRALDFRSIATATLPATVISAATAVGLAATGFGPWALVAQRMAASSLTMMTYWGRSSWRPQIASVRWSTVRELSAVGLPLLGVGLQQRVFENVYVLVIGKLFGVVVAGQYFMAERVIGLVVQQFVSAVQTASFPSLAKVQGDRAKLKDGYRAVVRITMTMLAPVVCTLFFTAPQLFFLGFGHKWDLAARLLQWLCIGAIMYPLHLINHNSLIVLGEAGLVLKLALVKRAAVIMAIIATAPFGVETMAIGYSLVQVFNFAPNSYYSGSLLAYPAREQVGDVLPIVAFACLCSALGAGIAWLVATGSAWFPVVIAGTCIAAYLTGLRWVAPEIVTLLKTTWLKRTKRAE